MFEPAPAPKKVAPPSAPPGYRLPTKDEQIKAWEKLMFQINLRRTIDPTSGNVETCLKRIDAFVEAHNKGRDGKEVMQSVIAAFWEQIAETPSVGLTKLVAIDSETVAKKAPVKRAPAKKTRKRKTTGAKRGPKPKVTAA